MHSPWPPTLLQRVRAGLGLAAGYASGGLSSSRRAARHRTPAASGAGLGEALARLQAGIAYERTQGYINAPGRRVVFSEFLCESLERLSGDAGGWGEAALQRRLRAAAAPVQAYPSLSAEQREAALAPLMSLLEELAKRKAAEQGSAGGDQPGSGTQGDASRAARETGPSAASKVAATWVPVATKPQSPPKSGIPDGPAIDACAAEHKLWDPNDRGEHAFTDTAAFVLDLETTGERERAGSVQRPAQGAGCCFAPSAADAVVNPLPFRGGPSEATARADRRCPTAQ